jgi:hypothetical protein
MARFAICVLASSSLAPAPFVLPAGVVVDVVLRAVLMSLVAWGASGCVANPASPTDLQSQTEEAVPAHSGETVPVRVYVLQFGSNELPLSGVSVRVDQRMAGETDAAGFAMVHVARGVPVTIGVDRAGYQGFSAEGVIWGASESWRFWLEPSAP